MNKKYRLQLYNNQREWEDLEFAFNDFDNVCASACLTSVDIGGKIRVVDNKNKMLAKYSFGKRIDN